MDGVHQGLQVLQYPGMVNVVADVLSRKPKHRLSALRCSLTLSEFDFDFRPQTGRCIILLGTIMV